MKKVLIGVLAILIIFTLFSYEKVEYEYYDLDNNYGISNLCIDRDDGVYCKINSRFRKVNQYSLKEE